MKTRPRPPRRPKENISLKDACVALGFLTAEKFDEVFHPEQMA